MNEMSKVYGIDLKKKYLQLICHILDSNIKVNPCNVYLFGSRAFLKARYSSDIDLAVESPSHIIVRNITYARMALEESTLPYRVDLVNMDDLSDELRKSIQEKGVLIWSRSTRN